MKSSKRLVIAIAAGLCMAGFTQQAAAHDEPVVGSLVGAGIGAAVAGPPGAAVGAVIGAAIGSHVAHESDHGNGRHYSRTRVIERREVRYVAPARYAYYGNGNGGTVVADCPPQPVYYRANVVHRDDRVKKVSYAAPVAKPKVKKVCKWVKTG